MIEPTAPKVNIDLEEDLMYLTLDNTEEVRTTETVPCEFATVNLDYDRNGCLLGIEVLW